MASLEQSVEMRNVPEPDLERYFRYRSPLLLVDQTLRAKSYPPVIQMLSHRAARRRKQLVNVALRAPKRTGERFG